MWEKPCRILHQKELQGQSWDSTLQAVSIIQLQQEGPKENPVLMGKPRPRGTAMCKAGASQRKLASATILGGPLLQV